MFSLRNFNEYSYWSCKQKRNAWIYLISILSAILETKEKIYSYFYIIWTRQTLMTKYINICDMNIIIKIILPNINHFNSAFHFRFILSHITFSFSSQLLIHLNTDWSIFIVISMNPIKLKGVIHAEVHWIQSISLKINI